MNGKRIRGNILFVLTTFVVFILLFEHRLSIPTWMEPLGRLHPMFVHFPIVVVILALLLDALRYGARSSSDVVSFGAFAHYLLFAGAVLSGVTVIMGVFLVQEGLHDGKTIFWHKWSGVFVFLFSALVYTIGARPWFTRAYSSASVVVALIAVVVAGLSGARITHGEDYIWQPLANTHVPAAVPFNEANVFEHVIAPIFESKCSSCHGRSKRKGELLLIDSASIMTGGETGALFMPGSPANSLLFERLTLPLAEKEHMPPREKPQLTALEKDILYHWIKSGAPFNSPLVNLPEADTLRMLAARKMDESTFVEYDFAAFDQQAVAKLNSNYRVVRPVSKDSPALTVNLYNRAAYTPAMLEELRDVSDQVVALDLSNLPVTDNDLRHVGRLPNLRKLNLNFSEVTDDGLAYLHPLDNLLELSVSGTPVSYAGLKTFLAAHPKLRMLALWEAALDTNDIHALQAEFRHVAVLGAPQGGMALIKLNTPALGNKKRVFRDSVALDLFHPVAGTEIRFTTDGSEPDSLGSTLYRGPTMLRTTTTIKARAQKTGWLSSDVATLRLYRSAHMPDTAILLSRLNRVHVHKGAPTFFDHELGTFNANSPAWANNWGGVRNNDLLLLLGYDSVRTISSISFNCLIETENSIFPPETVEVWGGESPDALTFITRKKIDLPGVYRKPYIELFDVSFEEHNVRYLKIVARPVMKLPAWHKNTGKAALLLMDEILIN